MSLHWYACISMNTYCHVIYHISLETVWWALSNASSIMWIRSAIHEILADKVFTATDGLISQSFVVAFVHPTYVRIALIWNFPEQLILWKLVHWLWKYKLNKVCNSLTILDLLRTLLTSMIFLKDKVGKLSLMWTISSMLILEVWAYDFLVVVVVKLFSFDFNEFWGELVLGFDITLEVLAKHSDTLCQIDFLLLSALSLS